jgi:predicted small secreted protein
MQIGHDLQNLLERQPLNVWQHSYAGTVSMTRTMRVLAIALALCVSLAACATHESGQDTQARKAGIVTADEECKSEMLGATDLDPIRNKVELYKQLSEGPPPFEIASNDTFPTANERPIIAKWATIRDSCIKRQEAWLAVPTSANTQLVAVLEQEVSIFKEATANIGELIVSLYQQKLTYGEFAQKRYWISSQASAAELAYRQSVLDRDEQRRLQAQQQFATTLTAWGNYIQAVEARQPQTVYINGTIRVR